MGWVIVLHAAGVVPTETVSVVFDPTLAGGAGVGTGTGLLVDRDLDNRLRQISGLTALLPSRIPLDEDQTRLVGQIIKLTRETARLVNNLVYLHELESGTTMLREPLDLGPLLGDLVERYQPAAIRRGVSLKLHAQLLPPMPGYAPAIGRALQNLLENAIKYTPSGGTIMVGVDEQENQAEITVSDTGIGLWPRDLGLVFNRFYRVINPQNQETPSAGLGLAVVKAVAEAHGGRAWATSTLGQGSVFGLTLPLFEG